VTPPWATHPEQVRDGRPWWIPLADFPPITEGMSKGLQMQVCRILDDGDGLPWTAEKASSAVKVWNRLRNQVPQGRLRFVDDVRNQADYYRKQGEHNVAVFAVRIFRATQSHTLTFEDVFAVAYRPGGRHGIVLLSHETLGHQVGARDRRLARAIRWTVLELLGLDSLYYESQFALAIPEFIPDDVVQRVLGCPDASRLRDLIVLFRKTHGRQERAPIVKQIHAAADATLRAIDRLIGDHVLTADDSGASEYRWGSDEASWDIRFQIQWLQAEALHVILQLDDQSIDEEQWWDIETFTEKHLASSNHILGALDAANLVKPESDYNEWYDEYVADPSETPTMLIDLDTAMYDLLDIELPWMMPSDKLLAVLAEETS
jgi:hypothetical protein